MEKNNIPMPTHVSMTWNEWEEKYKPIQNHISHREEFNGCLFETYDEDLEYVKGLKNNHEKYGNNNIWTLLTDDNGDLCISEGYHIVNRLGYFITEIPFGENESIFVQDEDDITKD